MSNYSQIVYEVKNAVAHITLNRPEKRNALSDQLVKELLDGFQAAEANSDVKVVVLRGAGKDFCAGADLAQIEKISQASVLENLTDAAAASVMFARPRKMTKPVIAAVHGRAFAGGAGSGGARFTKDRAGAGGFDGARSPGAPERSRFPVAGHTNGLAGGDCDGWERAGVVV